MVELWLWERTQGGSITEVKKFDTEEEAQRYIDLNRNGRNVVFVTSNDDRGNVWRLIGARCPM